METTTIKIPVSKIASSTDRKYGGEGNIETLAQSIKEHGLIHPLAVKENPGKKGTYRVIAGRRRFAAVKSLGWKTVDATVYPEKANDEAVALAENVNREDMHPLDEAEKFKRELDAGKSVEEIAAYYNRSVSGIHQRVRLNGLADGIKAMFRDGRLNLSGAALVASLPEGDQEKFLKKYEGKNPGLWDIKGFILSVQHFTLDAIADIECGKCKKRTYNTAPGLFDEDESNGLCEVCFDGECYSQKWRERIADLIVDAEMSSPVTEDAIILDRGIPKFIPPKTASIGLPGMKKEFAVLAANKYSWSESKKKGKDKTAWLVYIPYQKRMPAVSRVAYKEYEQPKYVGNKPAPDNPVKNFLIDQLPGIKPEDRKAVAEKMKEEFLYSYKFLNLVREVMFSDIISEKIKKGEHGNLAALYLSEKCSGEDSKGKWHEIDPDLQDVFSAIFGAEGITKYSEIPATPLTQKLFLFLIINALNPRHMPTLDDIERRWESVENSLFWKFAGLGKDEYIQMCKDAMQGVVDGVMAEPKKKDGKKKKGAAGVPAEPAEGDDDGMEVPF